MIEFRWDESKARRNLREHKVSFEDAQSVFYDDYARQFYDEQHSHAEDHFLLLGVSNLSRVLLVCDCEIEGEDIIRIISTRKATTKEKRLYEGPNP